MGLLMTRLQLEGVAVLSVNDGIIYAFTKAKLLEFVAACDAAGKDEVVVFVRHGEEPAPYMESNN